MTNDERNPKPECRNALSCAIAGFVIRHSGLRITICSIQKAGQRTGESGPGVGWFMESPLSFLRMHWDHEPACGAQLVWCPAFRRSGPAKAGTPNRRFMESPHFFLKCIGTMKPVTAWSPGFSRSKRFEPPEGGTPNQRRFMERTPRVFRGPCAPKSSTL